MRTVTDRFVFLLLPWCLLTLGCTADTPPADIPQAEVSLAEIPPAGNPTDWACQDTLQPLPERQIQQFCSDHPPNQPGCEADGSCTRGNPAQWPLAPATLGDLDNKNRFDLWFGSWLKSRLYATPVSEGGLGWFGDQAWRLTGPIVGQLCSDPEQKECRDDLSSGYLKSGGLETYGVHPAVRVYYSPGVIDWLCGGRDGDIPDGAAIIKEMGDLGGLAVEVDAQQCMTISTPPAVTGWAPWVRANDIALDGWYWGGGISGGNPPIVGPSAAVNAEDETQPPQEPDPEWYPTGNSAKSPIAVYPYNMYAPYCINCHASAKSHLTFASMENILGQGIAYKLYAPRQTGDLLELRELSLAAHAGGPGANKATLSRVPYATPLAQPSPDFLGFYSQLGEVSFESAWQQRLPAETYDHVFSGPGGPGQFLTSDQCIGCHDATNSNSSTAHMLFPIDESGNDYAYANLSPYAGWRVSPMGLAGRDPIFFSQLQSETNNLPELAECIENTCLHCHGVMGQRQLGIDTQGPAGEACKSLFPVPPPTEVAFGDPFRLAMVTQYQDSSPHAKYGSLARDGISCTVCHHVVEQDLGEEKSFTGNFVTGPGDEVYGPYQDDTVVTKPMQHGLGITPRFGKQTADSELCSSCHNILLPVFSNSGEKLDASYEQTTGLEWNNSDFAKSGDSFRSCQDCHMSVKHQGQKLSTKIANIESAGFAPTTERLPDADITLTERDRYPLHTLAGLNVFLNEMFQQFPVILGLRQQDYMLASVVKPALLQGRDDIIAIARRETASIEVDSLERTSDGKLRTVVTVTNKAGHYLPSGVGFRRVFVDFRIKDENGEDLWASGRTNELGVILQGLTNKPLPSEEPVANPRAYQPHYQTVSRDDQVQIYQELIKDSAGDFTTSFLRRVEDVKDNRLRPRGYDPAFFERSSSPYIRKLAEAHGKSGDDPYYTDPTLTGADRIEYLVSLDPAALERADHVEVRLYNQSIPPGYLQQRFRDANRGPKHKSEIERLFYITSHLNTAATDGSGLAFIADWKLELACTSQPLAGPVGDCE